jgi:site-specific recombinase XerD
MKKKETEFLTEEEAQAMFRVPDRRTLQGKRDYAILLTLLTTGLRKAEICTPLSISTISLSVESLSNTSVTNTTA